MAGSPLDFEKPIDELDQLIAQLKSAAKDPVMRSDAESRGIDIEASIAEVEATREDKMRHIFGSLNAWNKVQMARHKDRPYTLDYIRLLCDDFFELHGDRTNADDPAIVGGLARFRGQSVVVLGHQKGRDLKERQMRNFGYARPAGFRKAMRMMHMADKFGCPLLVFVDTPAAEANLMAEEEGVSETIALCLREMVSLRAPTVVTVIGEGGSGGALALAVGDRVLMLEHSVYSVIPPEGCAAILWNDKNRAAEAAEALKLTAQHAKEFGIVDEIIEEPLGGAHRDPGAMASRLQDSIEKHLADLQKLDVDRRIDERFKRYRNIGVWEDAAMPTPPPPKPAKSKPRQSARGG